MEKKDKEFKIKIYFSRKNIKDNNIENIPTSQTELTNSLLYFKNNIIKFKKIDIFTDIIEISFILICDKIKRCKPLLLDLKSLEINKSIKKLFEMPDKSYIDITYFIKEENYDESELNIFEEKLELKKDLSHDIGYKENNDINFKKYYTPMLNPKANNIFPTKLELNPIIEEKGENSNLAQKIFNKIFQKNQKDNLNNSFEIINYVDNNNIIENENDSSKFCLGIFITGLNSPIDNSCFFEISKNFISSCGHKNCSNLLSFKPDILSKYLSKNNELSNELNYLVANLCFPLGIKICFENLSDKINQKTQKVYYNVIKNAKDDIYYITTLQYFIKMNYKKFKEIYKCDLISLYTGKNLKENFLKKLKDESIIYIPESISLLSEYPFFMPMNICLNAILSLSTIQEKNCLINHLINEVPIPKKLTKVLFYIPSIKNPIVLNHNYNIYKSISELRNQTKKENNNNYKTNENDSMQQISSEVILKNIPVENIIFLFQLLLLEQQIVIVDNNYEILASIIFTLINLIYPLKWINPFLPILSLNTVKFLQTPVPFIMGIDEFLLKYALNSKDIYIGKEIIIYNISSKSFTLSKSKKKVNKMDILYLLKLNKMPEVVNKFLFSELRKKELLLEKNKNKIGSNEMDMDIRLIFLKTMLMIMGDYNNYIFYTNDDDMTLFNNEAFIEAHSEKQMKLFLEQFIKTQLFKQFLLNEKQLYLYDKNNKKIISKENNEIYAENNYDIKDFIDTSYFKKLAKKYPEFINDPKFRKSSFDLDLSYNDDFDINLDKNKNKTKFKLELNKENNEKEIQKSHINNKNLMIDLDKIKGNPLELNNFAKSGNLNKKKNKNFLFDFNTKKEGIQNNESYEYNNIIIKKTNKIKKYLLFPYFLEQTKYGKTLNYNIIYENILKYNSKQGYELFSINEIKNKIYIFSLDNLNLDFSKIDSIKALHYIINSDNDKLLDNLETDSIQNKNLNKNINEEKKEENKNILNTKIFNTQDEQSQKNNQSYNKEYCDLIKDCFTLCLTNKSQITKSQFSSLDSIFSENFYRNYFSNLIFPDIKIKTQHKQLMDLGFSDFVIMIKLCLSNLKEDEYEICRRITLACFSYYKIIEEKKYFVYQNLNSNNYKIWEIDLFWIEFFKIELKEAKNNEEILLDDLSNDKSIIEFKSKFNILMDISVYISKIMIKLNLKNNFINTIFEKMILPVYECDYENINKIMKKIKGSFPSN